MRLFSRLLRDADHRRASEGRASRYSELEGEFEFFGNRIVGWARDAMDPSDDGLTISVMQDRKFVACVPVTAGGPDNGWRFEVETGSAVSGHDILKETAVVLVSNRRGNSQRLPLDGASQLSLIRETMGPPSRVHVDIEFLQTGNSERFTRSGWSNPESTHRWSVEGRSVLALPAPSQPGKYLVEMLLWPFTVDSRLPSQRLTVSTYGAHLAFFSLNAGSNFVHFELPHELPSGEDGLTLTFDHPDAARPCDFETAKDSRRLALAFKRLRLVQRL